MFNASSGEGSLFTLYIFAIFYALLDRLHIELKGGGGGGGREKQGGTCETWRCLESNPRPHDSQGVPPEIRPPPWVCFCPWDKITSHVDRVPVFMAACAWGPWRFYRRMRFSETACFLNLCACACACARASTTCSPACRTCRCRCLAGCSAARRAGRCLCCGRAACRSS